MKTEVAIIGGGPAGLMLAIELGCRDIPCVLIEERSGPPTLPKANATSSRTMEHYRRRGFADQVRRLGLPPSHPQDVVYCTRLTGPELARFRIPSAEEAASGHGPMATTEKQALGRRPSCRIGRSRCSSSPCSGRRPNAMPAPCCVLA
ncbi:FAD-dependent monooxygenase [Delftia acidovorans]